MLRRTPTVHAPNLLVTTERNQTINIFNPIHNGGGAEPTDCIPGCPGKEKRKQAQYISSLKEDTHQEIPELLFTPPLQDVHRCSEEPETPSSIHL